MISASDVLVYGSIIAIDIYCFWTLYRGNKAITRYERIMDRVEGFLKKFEDVKTMRKTIRTIFGPELKKLHEILDAGQVYTDPRVIKGILENVIMDFLAHIGASNLKELGYKKEQISKINLAKQGLRQAGNLAAEGAGVNDLIKGVAGNIPVGEDGKTDPVSMIMRYFMGNLMGGGQGGGGGQPPKKIGGGGGGTVG